MCIEDQLNSSIEIGNYEEVKRLLKIFDTTSLSPRSVYQIAFNLIDNAVSHKYPLITQALLAKYSNFDSSRITPLLHRAVENCDIETVKVLLKHEADINATFFKKVKVNGFTLYNCNALHLAIVKEQPEIVQLFISKGADVTMPCCMKRTPLHLAARVRPEILRMFLEQNVDVDAKDIVNQTPIFEAVDSRCLENVELLINSGASISLKNISNQTVLHTGARASPEISQLLISRGADIEATDDIGETPLHCAVRRGLKNTEVLLNNGADLNATDICGKTPLFTATRTGHLNVIKYLLDKGSSINCVNHYGKSIPAEALISNHELAFLTFLENGFDINSLLEADSDLHYQLFEPPGDKILTKQIALMKSQHSSIDERFLELIKQSDEQDLPNFYEKCLEEIAKMREEKLDNTTLSYFDITTRDIKLIVAHARNKDIVRALSSCKEMREKFPIYGRIIDLQMKKGVERRRLVDKCHKSCDSIFSKLPVFAIEGILRRLSDVDINNLIAACSRTRRS